MAFYYTIIRTLSSNIEWTLANSNKLLMYLPLKLLKALLTTCIPWSLPQNQSVLCKRDNVA